MQSLSQHEPTLLPEKHFSFFHLSVSPPPPHTHAHTHQSHEWQWELGWDRQMCLCAVDLRESKSPSWYKESSIFCTTIHLRPFLAVMWPTSPLPSSALLLGSHPKLCLSSRRFCHFFLPLCHSSAPECQMERPHSLQSCSEKSNFGQSEASKLKKNKPKKQPVGKPLSFRWGIAMVTSCSEPLSGNSKSLFFHRNISLWRRCPAFTKSPSYNDNPNFPGFV